jgi:hypothetical protein
MTEEKLIFDYRKWCKIYLFIHDGEPISLLLRDGQEEGEIEIPLEDVGRFADTLNQLAEEYEPDRSH